MGENNKVKSAYALAVVLLIVGVVCYVTATPKIGAGEEPVRRVFSGLAGDVLFDHQGHMEYESDCLVCHHHGESDEFATCGSCHDAGAQETVPTVCADCHPLSGETDIYDEHHLMLEDEPGSFACAACHQMQEGEAIPVACGDCHDPDDTYYQEEAARIQMTFGKTDDAFHAQCIGCHQDMGGPIECGECHAQ